MKKDGAYERVLGLKRPAWLVWACSNKPPMKQAGIKNSLHRDAVHYDTRLLIENPRAS